MEILRVRGGRQIAGEVRLAAAKNAVLPIMAAALMADSPVVLRDVPRMSDIECMGQILCGLGCVLHRQEDALLIDPRPASGIVLSGELPTRLRSSIFLLGALLSRCRMAQTVYPGGCAIGKRPVDLHLNGLRALGARVEEKDGRICVDGTDMRAACVRLAFPSVGATENLMMAMACLTGESRILNAAREPEIADLAGFLNAMGARIAGAGTREIRIEGVECLHGVDYTPIPDRIVGGTLLCAAAVTGGQIRLFRAVPEHMRSTLDALYRAGAQISTSGDSVFLRMRGELKPISLKTAPFPGFPTDMQAPVMSLACCAAGESRISETLFENRFQHVDSLRQMGAEIRLEGCTAIVQGGRLHGATVQAKDLRCGAALVIAALAAEGESRVQGVELIDRGYDDFEGILRRLGADIIREQKD